MYLKKEQRRRAGCSARRMQAELHHGLPHLRGGRHSKPAAPYGPRATFAAARFRAGRLPSCAPVSLTRLRAPSRPVPPTPPAAPSSHNASPPQPAPSTSRARRRGDPVSLTSVALRPVGRRDRDPDPCQCVALNGWANTARAPREGLAPSAPLRAWNFVPSSARVSPAPDARASLAWLGSLVRQRVNAPPAADFD